MSEIVTLIIRESFKPLSSAARPLSMRADHFKAPSMGGAPVRFRFVLDRGRLVLVAERTSYSVYLRRLVTEQSRVAHFYPAYFNARQRRQLRRKWAKRGMSV